MDTTVIEISVGTNDKITNKYTTVFYNPSTCSSLPGHPHGQQFITVSTCLHVYKITDEYVMIN